MRSSAVSDRFNSRAVVLSTRPIFVEGVAASIRHRAGCAVVAAVSSIDRLAEVATSRRCELLVVDVDSSPPLDVKTALAAFRVPKGTHAVGLASVERTPLARVIARSPRSILLPTSITPAELARAVLTLTAVEAQASTLRLRPTLAGKLTQRQIEVLAAVSTGLSNRQIAANLGITEGTVKRHLYDCFGSLGAQSRLDAVNRARTYGLLPL